MDKKVFAQQIARLSIAFDKTIPQDLANLYWQELKGSETADFVSAVSRHIRESEFFPRISVLIQLMSGKNALTPHEAWAAVMKGLRDSENMNLPESVMKAVNALGGPRTLGHLSMNELEWKKKDFLEVYNPTDDATGLHDQQHRIDTIPVARLR